MSRRRNPPITFPQCSTRSNSRAPAPWQPPNERGADSDVSEADRPPRPGQLSSWLGRTIAPLCASSFELPGLRSITYFVNGGCQLHGWTLPSDRSTALVRRRAVFGGNSEAVSRLARRVTTASAGLSCCVFILLCSGWSMSRLGYLCRFCSFE